MDVVVPFDAREPNTRLAPVLDEEERAAFARAMLRDVLDGLEAVRTGEPDSRGVLEPTVLANAPVDVEAPVTVDERPLSHAVNRVLRERLGDPTPSPSPTDDSSVPGNPVAIVMADLALATPDALARLFDHESDVVVAPGRGGGTNALVVGHPAFRVDYHGASYRDHRGIAADVGASVAVVDSFRLTTDVDEPEDLPEVLLHAPEDGAARTWLREAGFDIVVTEGRVDVGRVGPGRGNLGRGDVER